MHRGGRKNVWSLLHAFVNIAGMLAAPIESLYAICDNTYVTGLAKTRIVCTKTETYFIALANSYTHEVSMHSVSTGPDELVCFS